MGSTYPGTPDYFGQEAPLVDLNELPSWLLHEDDDLLVFNKPGKKNLFQQVMQQLQ